MLRLYKTYVAYVNSMMLFSKVEAARKYTYKIIFNSLKAILTDHHNQIEEYFLSMFNFSH
jgi:hypothetical protein